MESRVLRSKTARAVVLFLAAAALVTIAMPAGAQSFPPYPGTQPTKSAASATVTAGGTITWTITLYNDAAAGPASVFISDDVPDPADGLPVAAWSIANDLISIPAGATPSYNGDILSISNIVIPVNETRQVVFRTVVLASAADGTQICNRAFARYVVEVCAGSPPLCSDETFDSGTRPPGAGSPGPFCVTVEAAAAGPDIEPALAESSATDSCPSDPNFPAPDGNLSPGETVNLTLAIQNAGGTDAAAQPAPIRGTIQPGTGYTVVSGTSNYSTTGRRDVLQRLSGNVGTNDDDFVIRIDPEAACPGTITIPLVVSSIQGGPYTVNFQFTISGCVPKCLDLALARGNPTVRDTCAGRAPNGAFDPGEDVFLVLPVTNGGPDDLGGNPTILGTIAVQPPVAGVSVLPGQGGSSYPDIPGGGSASNTTEFGIAVADSVACGTAFTLRLTLSSTDSTTRTIDFPFAVAASCTVCAPPSCTASAAAAAVGPTRICVGGSARLDASSSVVAGCSGPVEYQWLEGGVPVPGATQVTYATPTSLPAGPYSYTVRVTCSTDPNCTATSTPVDVTVEPQPLVVQLVYGVKSALDARFEWLVEPTATGGYAVHRTDQRLLAGSVNASIQPAIGTTAASPNANTYTDPGVLGPAEPFALYYYQILALCVDGTTEGPN